MRNSNQPPDLATPTVQRQSASKRPPAVAFGNVSKHFDETAVIECMNLSVDMGEKLVIIGPSGSGKTTVLRLMMTLEKPDNGRIEIDGSLLGCAWNHGRLVEDNRKNLRMIRRNVGMVFQQFNLFPHMTAIQNVMEAPLRSLRMSKADAHERAMGLLERVGMANKTSSYPGQLSGGQQQRVAVARALALRPKVMLFDEVTSALDPESVGDILHLIRDLADEFTMAMVIVTHEMGFAKSIADRIIFMDDGKIIESGPPNDVLENPQNPRTIAFLRALLDR